MTSKRIRAFASFSITDYRKIKQQMLNWAAPFNICCFLDNQQYELPLHRRECLLAVGAYAQINASAGDAFHKLKKFARENEDWLFGHFAYGLVRETELSSAGDASTVESSTRPSCTTTSSADPIGFPDLFFFVPEILIELDRDVIRIGCLSADPATIFADITSQVLAAEAPVAAPSPPVFHPRISREEYLGTIKKLQQHILRGDCYEINFCQEFYTCPAPIHPLQTWFALSQASPNPFSAFYRLTDSYLFCASPERYLQKQGKTLFSQPIKGTSARITDDPALDRASAQSLYNSAKDRAENVMVVDLVRNDLSKICQPGSVSVEELYGIYSFPQVHQMISTVRGELSEKLDFTDAIRATFPMGSMTGAPKKRVVELIRQYEPSTRGLFSGAVGYVTPDGDCDFNVVIRSLFYQAATQYLSYQVGSGITFYSDPAAEYEECMIKAAGIRKALSATVAI